MPPRRLCRSAVSGAASAPSQSVLVLGSALLDSSGLSPRHNSNHDWDANQEWVANREWFWHNSNHDWDANQEWSQSQITNQDWATNHDWEAKIKCKQLNRESVL